MEIIRPLSTVRCDDSTNMIVIYATIGLSAISYHCEWWDDQVLRSGTFHEDRLELVNGSKQAAGFLNPATT